jgi:hypothetical protein
MVSIDEPEPPLMAAGLKTPEAPDGGPVTFRATFPLNPLMGLTLIAYVVLFPAETDWDPGEAERVKSAGAVVTTKVTVTECVRLPLVPVIVIVEFPAGVELPVLTVNAVVAEPFTETGLKAAVAPAGNPLATNETVPLNPAIPLTVTV